MANGKPLSGGQIPSGFVSPFNRVQMEERADDALSCIAILTGRTLAEVNKMAVTLGYPAHGPAWVDISLIAKLLFNLSNLVASDYKDFVSLDAMPDVAILMVDYKEDTDIGRHVVWHHVRGTAAQPAFSYVIDPAGWLDPKHHVTADFGHLSFKPAAFYIEITQKPKAGGKTK